MFCSACCGHVPRGYIQFRPRVFHFSAVHSDCCSVEEMEKGVDEKVVCVEKSGTLVFPMYKESQN